MQNESISQLKHELEKFTSFDYPENIRSLANDAVLYFTKGGTLPISDPDSYVVRMISTIFMNPKLAKSSPNFLISIFNSIADDVFAYKGLERILNGIISTSSSESSLDLEIAKSILNYTETNIGTHFPHLYLIQILMSIILAMFCQSNQSISDESFKSFPNILNSLVETIELNNKNYNSNKESEKPIETESEVNKTNLTPIQKLNMSISDQKLNFNHQYDQFDQNPFNYILYLIFNDFISIALNQKPQWLLLPADYKKPLYSKIVFDALEIIVRTHHKLIESEPSLICIFEPAVIQSMWDTNALEFIICFIDIYLETHPSLCIGLFEEFLSRIPTHKIAVEPPTPVQMNEPSQSSNSKAKTVIKKPAKGKTSKAVESQEIPKNSNEINLNRYDFPLPQISNQALASFYFFRSIATNEKDFASRFYATCDSNDNKLFERLFNSLQLYIERQLFYDTGAPARKRHHLSFKLVPTRWKLLQTAKAQQKFIQKSPFEIVFGILNSFVLTNENQHYNEEEDSNEIKSFETDYEERYGNFVQNEKNLQNISKLALSAMRCSTLETFKLPCNFLTNVLRLLRFTKSETNQQKFKDSFYQAFGSICDFANKLDKGLIQELQVELQISDKIGLFYLSLRNLAEKHPELCSGNWVIILTSLFKEKVSFELDFASNFSDHELSSIVESAISIKPLPYIFITNLINANQSGKRFKLIWSILEPFFNKALDDIDVMITGKSLVPQANDNDSSASNISSSQNEPLDGEKHESSQRIIQSRNFDVLILELLLDIFNRAIFNVSEIDIVSMIYKYISDQKLALVYKERILAQLRTVLTEKGLVIIKSWNILFNILSPNNFKNKYNTIEADNSEDMNSADSNTELLHFAFNVLTLLSNDLIHRVPQDSLFNLINLIISYGNCTVDINVSLSSFDLLWNVVRVMTSNESNWAYLMKQVLALVPDKRNDVSQCAIKTFFSLMCTNFDIIPSNVIEYFVGTGFTEILNALDINNQRTAPNFELALQEFAHYSSTFWTSFDKIEAFHKTFLPELVEKAKTFCIICQSNEIVANSFHFFETMFECINLDPVTAELLRKGIDEMADNYINIRNQNNMIFSCFGRLLNCIIFSLKKRNTLETLPLWFPLMRKIVTGLTADGYIHITPQRLLDVLPSLYPMCDVDTSANLVEASENDNDDYSNEHKVTFTYSDQTYHSKVAIQLIQLLVEFLSSDEKYLNKPLQEFLFDILCQIYQTQMPDDVRLAFIMSCKQLGSSIYSKNLSTLFINTEIRNIIDTKSAPDVFECLLTICTKWPELQDKSRRNLVDVLDKADNELQLSFIHANREIIPIILLIWTTYFDPNSERFTHNVFENCFSEVLDVLSVLLVDANTSSSDHLQILKYIEKSLTPENAIGNSKQTQQSHLLRLMTPLTKLITSQNEEVRKTVQEIFEIITNIVSSML